MKPRTHSLVILAGLALLAAAAFAACRVNPGASDAGAPPAGTQLLRTYALIGKNLPSGYEQTELVDRPNPALAAVLQDPDAIAAIVRHGRVTGLQQTLVQRQDSRTVSVSLNLYLDTPGAQAALNDLAAAPHVQPIADVPAVGDMRVATQLTAGADGAQTSAIVTLALTRGRVEAVLTEAGSANADSLTGLVPLAERLDASLVKQPPPAPRAAERALVAGQTRPEAILHDAYRYLLENYHAPLSPQTLLSAAHAGAAASIKRPVTAPKITAPEPERAWSQFLPAYRQLEQGLDPGQARSLSQAAAQRMYDSLNDCHVSYYPPADYLRLLAMRRGEPLARLGIDLTTKAPITVVRVIPGSPAEAAELRPGDVITAIEGQPFSEIGETGYARLLRGQAGSTLTLTVQRPVAGGTFDVTAARALVPQTVVSESDLPSGIGYLDLDNFVDDPGVLDGLRQDVIDGDARGIRGWVLDLRYDQGGIEHAMQQVAGIFLPEQTPLVTVTTRNGVTTTLVSIGTPVDTTTPLVVLTSSDTASSAEMLAEALRDQGRAEIVGTRTSGCVDGGEILGLLDGSGLLVSTQHVLAGPQWIELEHKGVKPDISVENTGPDLAQGHDPQLDAAIAFLEGSSAKHP